MSGGGEDHQGRDAECIKSETERWSIQSGTVVAHPYGITIA